MKMRWITNNRYAQLIKTSKRSRVQACLQNRERWKTCSPRTTGAETAGANICFGSPYDLPVAVQIEELGSEGRVEEAQGMMKLVEQLKDEREDLTANPSVSHTDAHLLSENTLIRSPSFTLPHIPMLQYIP